MALQLLESIVDTFQKAEEAHNRGHLTEAIDLYRSCLAKDMGSVPARMGLAGAQKALGNNKAAVENFRVAYALAPHEPIVLVNLAVALEEDDVLEEAVALCESALYLEREDELVMATAHFVIGNCLEKSGQRKAAMSQYDVVLKIAPQYHRVFNNIGALLVTQGKLKAAEECFSKALSASPDHIDAHCNRGLVRMALGRYLEGMKEFEWRLESPESGIGFFMRSLPIPRWRGERLRGKTIMVHCEQGLGDTIFSARYIPQLTALGAKVLFRVQKELVRVFSCLESEQVKVVGYWEDPGTADYQVSVLSIPSITEHVDVGNEPYLWANVELVCYWHKKLHEEGKKLAAVCWGGNPAFKHEKERGVGFEAMEPLFAHPKYKFVSVQKGIAAYHAVKNPGVLPLSDSIMDMADTAAVLQNAEVVISSDTSVAHLAGAMGRPVYLLVQKFPEWRLTGTGNRSQWYKNVHLFRQEKHKDWGRAILEVADALDWEGYEPHH